MKDFQKCILCEREVSFITLHHLTPKQEGGKHSLKIPLCQPCHSTIHNTYTNKELAKNYNSIETLKKSEHLKGYLKWIKKQSIEVLRNK